MAPITYTFKLTKDGLPVVQDGGRQAQFVALADFEAAEAALADETAAAKELARGLDNLRNQLASEREARERYDQATAIALEAIHATLRGEPSTGILTSAESVLRHARGVLGKEQE